MLCLASAIFPVLILYSWRTSGSYLQRWMVDFYNDGESVVMSFISRSLLLLWNLSFVHADCAVHVTQTAQYMRTVQSMSHRLHSTCGLCSPCHTDCTVYAVLVTFSKYRYGSRLEEIPVRCYMTSLHPQCHCRNQPTLEIRV